MLLFAGVVMKFRRILSLSECHAFSAWSFLPSDANLKIWSWRDQFKRQNVSRFTVRMISSIFNRI